MHLLSLLFTLSAPVWFAGIHIVASRCLCRSGIARQKLTTLCLILGIPLITFFVLLFERRLSAPLLGYTFVMGAALAHIYFHIFNMSETARRIKVLIMARHESLPLDNGCARNYSPQNRIEIRIQRLLDLRQIAEHDERLFFRPTLLSLVAKVMVGYEYLLFPGRRPI